jgi:hypothetical protein
VALVYSRIMDDQGFTPDSDAETQTNNSESYSTVTDNHFGVVIMIASCCVTSVATNSSHRIKCNL